VSESDEDYEVAAAPSPRKQAGKSSGKGKKVGKKQVKAESDDEEEPSEAEGDAEELVRSQTQYARWHQQPQHVPSREKRGVKIVGWNVNGLRAIVKKGGGVKGYVDAEDPGAGAYAPCTPDCVYFGVCIRHQMFCVCRKPRLTPPSSARWSCVGVWAVAGFVDAVLYFFVLFQFSKLLPGYHASWACSEKKGYAGVALFSKVAPLSVSYGINHGVHDTEGRVVTAEFDRYYVVSSCVVASGLLARSSFPYSSCCRGIGVRYIPNSGAKLERLDYRSKEWDVALLDFLKKLRAKKPVVCVCGYHVPSLWL
jgi:hypothetical protein